MDTTAAFGFQELFNHVIGDMAKAMCERNGETQQQQFARAQAVTRMIMGFLPRDVIEAVLAGHCIMFHEVMTDSVRHTLGGEMDTMRRATRANLVAMDKAFGNNLALLERYQNRPSEGRRDAPEVARPETAAAHAPPTQPVESAAPSQPAKCAPPNTARDVIAPGARTPVKAPARDAAVRVASVPAAPATALPDEIHEVPLRDVLDTLPPHLRQALADYQPSPEAIAACQANPEAMAALEDCDPERFAIAMGIDMPSEAFLLAAKRPGSPFGRVAAAPANVAAAPRSRG